MTSDTGQHWDVFISHATQDVAEARSLRERLAGEGWTAFVASDDLDEVVGSAMWSRGIDDALDRSAALVVLVSENMLASRWVEYEWRSVHDDILSGRRGPETIVPICLSRIAPEELERALRRYQAVDMRDPDTRTEALDRAISLLRAILPTPAATEAGRADREPPLAPRHWEELFQLIELGAVIPVIGSGLAGSNVRGGSVALDQTAAERVAARLALRDDIAGETRLGDLCARAIRSGVPAELLYATTSKVCSELRACPSETELRLAEMDPFDLFVTLSWADGLEQALQALSGRGGVESLAYSLLASTVDIPAGAEGPFVFHLAGRAPFPDFVLTNDDLQEVLLSLLQAYRRPARLMDRLADSALLFLGCQTEPGLGRLLVRVLAGRRIDGADDLDGAMLLHDGALRSLGEDAAGFVIELSRRWSERRASVPGPGDMQSHDVYISAAPADRVTASALQRAIEHIGLEVWTPVTAEPEGGGGDIDAIRRRINGCVLFVPIISKDAVDAEEGIFRMEWSLAAERSKGVRPDLPFLLPVVLSDISAEGDSIPGDFVDQDPIRCELGDYEKVVGRVKEAYRDTERAKVR